MPSAPRDMNATWRSLAALCREFDWSKRRLLYELQNGGLVYRTFPPGHVIDWHHPDVEHSLDVKTSNVAVLRGVFGGPGLGFDRPIVGVEVMLPTDAPPAPSLLAPSPPPASPKKVSEAEAERCFRAIVAERPDDPLNEEDLLAEMKKRLGASPGRPRVRNMWKRIAPEWKRPVGAPSKKISAKKSAE